MPLAVAHHVSPLHVSPARLQADRPRTVLVVPVYNEAHKLPRLLTRVPRNCVDDLLLVDDGSTDGSGDVAERMGVRVLRLGRNGGVGQALRCGFEVALHEGAEVIVTLASNGKDDPAEIPQLMQPVLRGDADLVQGSRYLGQKNLGQMPLYRRMATRLHAWLVSRLTGVRITDSTNAFRVLRADLLRDPRLNLAAPDLNRYELEPFLLIQAVRLGYRVCEEPITKVYPPRAQGQTKMRPLLDWISIARPLLWALLGRKGLGRQVLPAVQPVSPGACNQVVLP